MMLFRTGLLALLLVQAPHLHAQEKLPPLTPESEAPPAVELAKPEGFDALRQAYARRADYGKRCTKDRPNKAFAEHMNAKEFNAAAQLVHKWLEGCPVDARVHLWAMSAFLEAGNRALAEAHRQWFLGLTDSAMRSGSGKTADDPMETISIDEEYAIVRRLGLTPLGQSLIQGETLLDQLRVKDDQGVESTLYFNPKWHFIRLAHAFPDGKR